MYITLQYCWLVVVLVQMLLAEQGRQYPHGWVDPAAQSAGPNGTASSSLLRSRAAAVAALSPARAGGGGGLGGEGGAGSLMEGTLAFLAASAAAAADP